MHGALNPFEVSSRGQSREKLLNEGYATFEEGDKIRDLMKMADHDYQMDQGLLQSQIVENKREVSLSELLDREPVVANMTEI